MAASPSTTPRWLVPLLVGAGVLAVGAVLTSGAPAIAPGTRALTLANAPFPDSGFPGALAHMSHAPDGGMVTAWVYVHGWNSCVTAVAGDAPQPCRPGGPTHRASAIVSQFDAVGAPGLLVLPELRVEANSGHPGRFANAGGFDAFLDEVAEAMGLSASSVDRVVLMAHSGGYQAVAAALRTTTRTVAGVALFDALYGFEADFTLYGQRAQQGSGGHLAMIATGSTLARVRAVSAALGIPVQPAQPTVAGLRAAPATAWQVSDDHGDVPRYVGTVVAAWASSP